MRHALLASAAAAALAVRSPDDDAGAVRAPRASAKTRDALDHDGDGRKGGFVQPDASSAPSEDPDAAPPLDPQAPPGTDQGHPEVAIEGPEADAVEAADQAPSIPAAFDKRAFMVWTGDEGLYDRGQLITVPTRIADALVALGHARFAKPDEVAEARAAAVPHDVL